MDAPSVISARCKYPVFISYSHRDERWARWLHKAIEGYRVPKPLVGRPGRNSPIPPKIFPVFRDRDELASSADLPSVLREALAQSSHLIVLCSPAAAGRRWVNEEIALFKRLGRADRILPLIVDGEPHAAAPEPECFPPALRFAVDAAGRLTDQPAEPISADLRPEADGKENAKLKLIAGVLGVPFNDLRQRELIAARRRARVWQAVGAAMLLLAMLAVAGGWMAWRYGQHAEGLLADAIGISADQLGGAVRVADQQGVSRPLIEELLGQAEAAFDGLYRRTAEAPRLPWRQAAVPAPLRGEHAVLLLVLADQYGKLGNIARQRQMAEQARSELATIVDEEPSDPEWRRQVALANDLIGRPAGLLADAWIEPCHVSWEQPAGRGGVRCSSDGVAAARVRHGDPAAPAGGARVRGAPARSGARTADSGFVPPRPRPGGQRRGAGSAGGRRYPGDRDQPGTRPQRVRQRRRHGPEPPQQSLRGRLRDAVADGHGRRRLLDQPAVSGRRRLQLHELRRRL